MQKRLCENMVLVKQFSIEKDFFMMTWPCLYHNVIVMIVTFDTMWKFKALFVICVSNISLMCIFPWIFVKLKFSIPIYHQSIAWFYAHWRIKLDTLNTHHLFRCTCLILHKNIHCLVPKILKLHCIYHINLHDDFDL